MQKTQGQIEAAITAEIVKFDKEFMGRGPSGCRTHLIDDLVLVHLKGCLTPSEFQFVSVNQNNPNLNGSQTTLAQNREAIKTMRREILERGRSLLEKEINSLTGRNVISLHTDLSTKNGDRLFCFCWITLQALWKIRKPKKNENQLQTNYCVFKGLE